MVFEDKPEQEVVVESGYELGFCSFRPSYLVGQPSKVFSGLHIRSRATRDR